MGHKSEVWIANLDGGDSVLGAPVNLGGESRQVNLGVLGSSGKVTGVVALGLEVELAELGVQEVRKLVDGKGVGVSLLVVGLDVFDVVVVDLLTEVPVAVW